MAEPAASSGAAPPGKDPDTRARAREAEPAEWKEVAWERPFLRKLEETGSVSLACREAGIHRSTAYEHKEHRTPFRERWNEIVQSQLDDVEASMMARATIGWNEPIYYKDRKVGEVTRWSDNLQKFILERRRPGKWADRSRIAGPNQQTPGEGADAGAVDGAEAIRRALRNLRGSTYVDPPKPDEPKAPEAPK